VNGPGRDGPRQGGERLRAARLARGITQRDLAELAGVTRQAVAALEAGRSEPSLRVAFALAHATGSTVDELFGPGVRAPMVRARPLAALGDPGARVALARVGTPLVALPMSGDAAMRAGFAPAGGVLEDPPDGIRPLGAGRPTVVVAGCDPALPLVEGPLAVLDPPVAFAWWPCGSGEALELAASGAVHAAGIHLRDDASGSYNVEAARARLGATGGLVVGFAAWREGLVVRPGLGDQVGGLADVARLALRIVNREPGSEARALLDRTCEELGLRAAELAGYETEARGHLQVASAVAARLADVGIASEPAARAYGLGFVPLADERYDLVVPRAVADTAEVHALLRVLGSSWLRAQLGALPGYAPAALGEIVAVLD